MTNTKSPRLSFCAATEPDAGSNGSAGPAKLCDVRTLTRPSGRKSGRASGRVLFRHGSHGLWTFALAALLGCEAEAPSTPMAKKPAEVATESAAPATTANSGGEASAPTEAAAATGKDGGGQPLTIENVSFTAPAGWVAKPIPPGGFIDAEFALPKADGDDADGRLTLSRAGGAVDANIDRWRGQFGGSPEKDEVKTLEVAGVQVTWVDLAGEFNDSRGPMAPPKKKAGYRMLAAIIPAGDVSIFVKATGPQKTLASHAESLIAFVKTAKIDKP